jgi:hypothetical protein
VHHGFLRQPDGTITTINVRGAGTGSGQGTLVQNINTRGIVDGYEVDASGVAHGFLGSTKFDAPGAGTASGQGTFIGPNNSVDEIAGYYLDGNNVAHGYLLRFLPPLE